MKQDPLITMDPMIPYAPAFVAPRGAGLINRGATCYFNALVQLLQSCSALNEVVMQNPDCMPSYQQLVSHAIAGTPQDGDIDQLWRAFMQAIGYRNGLTGGQQCAGEAFVLLVNTLINSVPNGDVGRVFRHRAVTEIFCDVCDGWRQASVYTNTLFQIENTASSPLDFIRHMLECESEIDQNHVCGVCSTRGPKRRRDKLTMVPEIIIVLVKKYDNALQVHPTMVVFPQEISFSHGRMRYVPVAQIEHSGTLAGGHYWAVCRRRDGWWTLNDTSATPAATGFAPSHNTYIVAYHIV